MTAPRSLLGILAAFGLAASLLASAPAVATPPSIETFDDPYNFTVEDWCGVAGLDVVVDGVATITEKIRVGKDGLEIFIQHFDITETHTANGVATTYVERSLVKDLKLTETVNDEGVPVLEVLQLSTGAASLYGPDGKAIARNPGQSRFLITFDLATGEELSFERVKGSTGRTDDFCAVEVPLFQ
jgi:hypothetical protein